MDIFSMNQDCMFLIFSKLDFDSLRELRKTCQYFKNYPLTKRERTIIKCGSCYEAQDIQEFGCRHYHCADTVVERVRLGKTKKVCFENDTSEVGYEYRYTLFKLNPESLDIYEIRDMFEWGLYSEYISLVLDTYQFIFNKLKADVDEYRRDDTYIPETNEFEGDIRAYYKIIQSRYFCRALANLGIEHDIQVFKEKLNVENYEPWEEEEEYVSFFDIPFVEAESMYLGDNFIDIDF